MNFISQIKKQKNSFSGKIEFDSSLSKYSWFNLGGSAKVILPNNKVIRVGYAGSNGQKYISIGSLP